MTAVRATPGRESLPTGSRPEPASGSRARALRLAGALLLGTLAVGQAGDAGAKVFYSVEEALQLAFPDASAIEKETLFLSEPEVHRVEGLARTRLESRMIPVHVGRHDQQLLGYAMLDIHIVRTQPEAVLVVLGPDGMVASTILLAFGEPLDYLPSGRWLRQFDRKTLTPDLALGQGIAAITGATLSAYGITDSVRRALAVYQVMLAPKRR